MVNWNYRFLELADHISSWSKDPSTKVGSVIFNPTTNAVLSIGYNGTPRGFSDHLVDLNCREAKLHVTEHAERNAIYNAARNGAVLEGAFLATTFFPCCDCARGIVQTGIKTIISPEPEWENSRWGENFKLSKSILDECGINIIFI